MLEGVISGECFPPRAALHDEGQAVGEFSIFVVAAPVQLGSSAVQCRFEEHNLG